MFPNETYTVKEALAFKKAQGGYGAWRGKGKDGKLDEIHFKSKK